MRVLRVWSALMLVVAAAAVVGGCGHSGDQPASNTTATTPGETHGDDVPVVHVSTRWISDNASDLATLTHSVDVVFVGSIADFKGQRFESAIQPTPATGGPLANEFPITLLGVTVDEPIVGGLAAGSTVTLEQEGGLSANADGSEVRLVLSGDEPLSVGSRYLFFASRKANGNLSSAPFQRFLVDEQGKLSSVPGWEHLPAVKRLSAINVDEASNEIAEAAR